MSAKFKPKKKEAEPVVDDWEASDDEALEENAASDGQKAVAESSTSAMYDKGSSSSGITEAKVAPKDAWGDEVMPDLSRGSDFVRSSKQNGRALWEEANRSAPQAQPVVVTNRSLPPTVLSPRLHAPTSGEYSQTAAPPPPQILRREKVGYGHDSNAGDKGSEKKKTLKEREEEYRKARERIFGSSTTPSSSSAKDSLPSSASASSSSPSTPNHSRPGSAIGSHSKSSSGKAQSQNQNQQQHRKANPQSKVTS